MQGNQTSAIREMIVAQKNQSEGRIRGEFPGAEELLSEGLMTLKEVAEFLRVSRFTVYRMIDAKELPAVLVRGLRRIPTKAVKDYIRSRMPKLEQ